MIKEKWMNNGYVEYTIRTTRKFNDHRKKAKEDQYLLDTLESFLLNENVLIYFDNDEIRCTLKDKERFYTDDEYCLKRDPKPTNFFTVWEIEREEWVTFYFRDVRRFIVREKNVLWLTDTNRLLSVRANVPKM